MKSWRGWAGLAMSVLFLYLAFRGSDWGRIWAVSQDANILYMLAALPFLFVSFAVRAWRWQYLVAPLGRPGLHRLFSSTLIGFMANNLLPLRIGEFVRAYVLGRKADLPVSGVLATIVVERLFDGFSLLLLLAVSLPLLSLPLPPGLMEALRAVAVFSFVFYLAVMGALIVFRKKTHWLTKLADFLLRPLPKLRQPAERLIQAFCEGLGCLSSSRVVVLIFGLSLLITLANSLFFWVTMYSFRLQGGLAMAEQTGLVGGMFLLVVLSFGVMIPSGPGYVGVFQWACIAGLTAMGVDRDPAESYAIVVHLFQFMPVTLAGIVYLYLGRLGLREVRAGGEKAREESESDG